MAFTCGGRERGSVFRRRRVRGVVLLSLVLVFTSVMPWGAVQIDWPQEAAAPLTVWQLEKLDGSIDSSRRLRASRRVA